MPLEALITLYKRGLTEQNRLDALAERLKAEIEFLRAGTLTEAQKASLDAAEQRALREDEECNTLDDYDNFSQESLLEDLQDQHKKIVETRENVRKLKEGKEVVEQMKGLGSAAAAA